MLKRMLPAVVLAAVFMSVHAAASENGGGGASGSDVKRETLANGLEVIVVPDRLAPVATTMLTYKVGSRAAPKNFPGIAHAQEHMMFRGTKTLSSQQIAAIGAALGGHANAFTTHDSTSYYYTVPSQFVDVALHVHAAQMKNVLDRAEDWHKERGAIEQEVSRDMSSPLQVAIKRIRKALYKNTPYAQDALGTRSSFDKLTAKQLKHFHDQWYVPNNAVLVVAGNVDAGRVLSEAKDLFGGISKQKLPERKPVKPGKVKSTTIRMSTDSGVGFAIIGSRAPGTRDADAHAAIQVLAAVLSNPRGPLYTKMVASGKALAASYTTLPAALGGIGISYVVFPKGADADSLVKQMRSILDDIAKQGINAKQVAAAKRQLVTGNAAERDSISGLAQRWTQAVAVDGLSAPGDRITAIKNVSADDVNALLAKLVQPDQSVLAVLTPQGSGAPQTGGGYGGSESFKPKNVGNVSLPEWAAKPLAKITTPQQTIKPVKTKLANGLQLITVPSDTLHAVHVYGHIRNEPDLQTPKHKEGVDDVLSELLDFGTKKHDRKAYQAALDAIGAQASAGTSFSLTVLPDHFKQGLDLLAENELHPALPKQAFARIQKRAAASQAGVIASPDFKANQTMRHSILPSHDPALRHATPQSISGLSYKDITHYYHKVFRPDLTTIVVAGDVQPDAVKKAVTKAFGHWQAKGRKPDVTLPKVPDNKASFHHVPDQARSQDKVRLAESLDLTWDNSDFYPLKMANQVLTGGVFASRLYRELRVQNGLVYYVGSDLMTQRNRTRLVFEYGSDPDKVGQADKMIRQALVQMAKVPISDKELHRARAGLVRQVPLNEAGADSISYGLLSRVELGQPLDEPYRAAKAYQSIDAKQIRAAVKKWLRPDDLVRVVQGPKPK